MSADEGNRYQLAKRQTQSRRPATAAAQFCEQNRPIRVSIVVSCPAADSCSDMRGCSRHRRTDGRVRRAILALASTLAGAAPASADQPPPGENAGIIRWAKGAYEYSALSDGRATGRETFYLTVTPDGTRTMRAFTDIFSRGVQVNAVVRVTDSFRPLTAYVDIATMGVLKGSGFYIAGTRRVDATIVDAAGHRLATHSELPDNFSFGTHPLALDGWASWYVPPIAGRVVKGAIYLVNGDAGNARPMTGDVTPVDLQYIGAELVIVPAGSFAAQHYRVAGKMDFWITGEDRLLVKYVWPAIDRKYLLSELTQGRSQRPADIDKRETTK